MTLPPQAPGGPHGLSLAVLGGLFRAPRSLPPSLLYDERGSCLFEKICELPEYYITRTETQILRNCVEELSSLLPGETWMVELGSGTSAKTRLLLDALAQLSVYVPVDISASHLLAAAQDLGRAYPKLAVLPVCADFTRPFSLPRLPPPAARVLVFFPGSTIGNLAPAQARTLLTQMRQLTGPKGALLIGFDLVKDVDVLERAYNDAAGITAAFNLNVLARLNRELGAGFELDAFRHEAPWVGHESRIEMHLKCLRNQEVRIADQRLTLTAGERLVTEHCHKYTPASFASLARQAGWRARRAWTDARGWFQVQYLHGYNDS